MANYDKNKIAKNTLFMYIRTLVQMFIGFYTVRLILQELGVSDYGIYNAVGGIVGMFVFLNNAMTQATQRFMSFELGRGNIVELNRVFSMCLNVHIIIAIVIAVASELVGLYLLYNKMIIPADRFNSTFWVLHFSVFTCVMGVIQVPYNASLYAHEKFDIYAKFQILNSIFMLLFVCLLKFINDDKLFWYAFAVLFVQLIILVLSRFYVVCKFVECKYKAFWDFSLFKKIIDYSSWSLVGDLSNTLSGQGVNVLLNIFFGPVVNAAQGIASKVLNAIASFVFNFQGASIPQIVKLYADNKREEMFSLVNKSSKISFFLFFLFMVPVCYEMQMLLHLWLGKVENYMVVFSILTLVQILVQALGGTLIFSIQATGNIKGFQICYAFLNIFIFILSYAAFKLGASPYFFYIIGIIVKILIDIITFYWSVKTVCFPIYNYLKLVLIPEFMVSLLGQLTPLMIILCFTDSLIRLFLLFVVTLIVNSLLIGYIGLNYQERHWLFNVIRQKINF